MAHNTRFDKKNFNLNKYNTNIMKTHPCAELTDDLLAVFDLVFFHLEEFVE